MKKRFTILFLLIIYTVVLVPAFALDSNYDLMRQKGFDAYKKGNYVTAIQQLTAIPKSEHTLEMVICIANCYESLGDVRSAVILLESLNKKNPNNYTAMYNLGNLYLKSKVYKNAIEAYKTSIRLNGRFAPAYYNLGIAYFNVKDYNKALFNFEKAMRLNPSNKDYVYNAAVCLEAMGNKKDAEEYFIRAK